jgi:hypothetical protein
MTMFGFDESAACPFAITRKVQIPNRNIMEYFFDFIISSPKKDSHNISLVTFEEV